MARKPSANPGGENFNREIQRRGWLYAKRMLREAGDDFHHAAFVAAEALIQILAHIEENTTVIVRDGSSFSDGVLAAARKGLADYRAEDQKRRAIQ